MITVYAQSIGSPEAISDEKGQWSSSIRRTLVTGPLALGLRGLAGDQVTDTVHHGRPDQAVCCHSLSHYDYWNRFYGLTGDAALGPGAVGENWTITEAEEKDLCVGDIYTLGSSRVQISAPRFPCWKQERKLQLPDFLKHTVQTLRTGFYVRVLTPGMVQAGDTWHLESRPHPDLTLQITNEGIHRDCPREIAQRLATCEELDPHWRPLFARKVDRE